MGDIVGNHILSERGKKDMWLKAALLWKMVTGGDVTR